MRGLLVSQLSVEQHELDLLQPSPLEVAGAVAEAAEADVAGQAGVAGQGDGEGGRRLAWNRVGDGDRVEALRAIGAKVQLQAETIRSGIILRKPIIS